MIHTPTIAESLQDYARRNGLPLDKAYPDWHSATSSKGTVGGGLGLTERDVRELMRAGATGGR